MEKLTGIIVANFLSFKDPERRSIEILEMKT